jgi:hypothetical protein
LAAMSSPQKALSSGDVKTPPGDGKKPVGTSGGKSPPCPPTPPKERGNRSRSRARTHRRRGRSGDARDREVVVERIVEKLSAIIVFQMGRARFAARGTTLKSTALARPEARSIVLSAGPAR